MPKRRLGKRTRRSHIGWLLKGKNKRCTYCGVPFTRNGPTRMTADHVKPLSKGGYDKRKNVVAACSRCNSRKGSMTVDEFINLSRAEHAKS